MTVSTLGQIRRRLRRPNREPEMTTREPDERECDRGFDRPLHGGDVQPDRTQVDFVERNCDADELARNRYRDENAVARDVARREDTHEADDQERDPLLLRRIRILEFPSE